MNNRDAAESAPTELFENGILTAQEFTSLAQRLQELLSTNSREGSQFGEAAISFIGGILIETLKVLDRGRNREYATSQLTCNNYDDIISLVRQLEERLEFSNRLFILMGEALTSNLQKQGIGFSGQNDHRLGKSKTIYDLRELIVSSFLGGLYEITMTKHYQFVPGTQGFFNILDASMQYIEEYEESAMEAKETRDEADARSSETGGDLSESLLVCIESSDGADQVCGAEIPAQRARINTALQLMAHYPSIIEKSYTREHEHVLNRLFKRSDDFFLRHLQTKHRSAFSKLHYPPEDLQIQNLKDVLLLLKRALEPSKTVVIGEADDDSSDKAALDRDEELRELNNTIIDYYTPSAIPEGYGFLNPRLILAPANARDDETFCWINENLIAPTFSYKMWVTLEDKILPYLQEYEKKRKNGMWDRFLDLFRPSTGVQSRPSSKSNRIMTVSSLIARLQSLCKEQKLADTHNQDTETRVLKKQISPLALAKFAKNCNQAIIGMYHPSLTKHSRGGGSSHISGESRLKEKLTNSVQALWCNLQNNQKEVSKLLLMEPKLTKQDLYYEFNILANFRIKEALQGIYSNATGGFGGWLREKLTRSNPYIRGRRNQLLSGLADLLMRAKTEEDYLLFLQVAENLCTELDTLAKHTCDYAYKEAIQKACCAVVGWHFLQIDSQTSERSSLSLNFSHSQVVSAQGILAKIGMQNSETYKVLTRYVQKKSNEEEPLKLHSKRSVKADASAHAQATQQDNAQNNIKHFKAKLATQLESHMLANLVISTGKVKSTPETIGMGANFVGMFMGMVPYAGSVGKMIAAGGSVVEEHFQRERSEQIANTIGEELGFINWWSNVAETAIHRLASLFENALKDMADPGDAEKFAMFCYERIYAALLETPEDLKEYCKDGPEALSPEDRLVAAVFQVHKKLAYFGNDTYKSRSAHPQVKMSFQELVDHVGIVVPRQPSTTAHVMSSIAAGPETQGKDKEKEKEGENLEREDPSDSKQVTAKELPFVLYLSPATFPTLDKTPGLGTKLDAYGVGIIDSENLATVISRYRVKVKEKPGHTEFKVGKKKVEQKSDSDSIQAMVSNLTRKFGRV